MFLLNDTFYYMDADNKIHAMVENNNRDRICDYTSNHVFIESKFYTDDYFMVNGKYAIPKEYVSKTFLDLYNEKALSGYDFLKILVQHDNIKNRILSPVLRKYVSYVNGEKALTPEFIDNFVKAIPVTLTDIQKSCRVIEHCFKKDNKITIQREEQLAKRQKETEKINKELYKSRDF